MVSTSRPRSERSEPERANLDHVDGRRSRWTQHRTERRAAFVEAGVLAVDQYGPAASAEQIAEAAGVSRTVLYRYFRDREDLRKAIADRVVDEVVASVVPALTVSDNATPRQLITPAIAEIVNWLDRRPNIYRFLRSRRDGGLDSVETTLADNIAVLLQAIMLVLGIDARVAEPGAYGVVGFVESIGGWWLEHHEMPRDQFTELVVSGVWHLLEGAARDHGVHIGLDDPLPTAAPDLQGLNLQGSV
ncbi:TetR/AcrR family transcriptional regulator [uncultured Jatrophihabitans sp.]|uniref:TetR/AcrR family transcriptional regulator n=1 Tax=uncultured Jatrophihabitans sp. TaxID=1610747 RepID=UPI0035C9ACBF